MRFLPGPPQGTTVLQSEGLRVYSFRQMFKHPPLLTHKPVKIGFLGIGKIRDGTSGILDLEVKCGAQILVVV